MITRKKTYLLIGIAIPIVIILAFYYWQQNKTPIWPANENKPITLEDNSHPLINNYDIDVQKINWVKAQFPGDGYHHDLDIWYPSTWQFSAGGDTDSFSRFWIQPFANEDLAAQPHITITDLGLFGCPKTIPECSIDQWVKKSSQEIFDQQLSTIKNYKEEYLSNLKIKAIAYEAQDIIEPSIARHYLLNTGNGVSIVSFFQFDKLGEDFISEFLKRLQVNK